MKNESEDKIGKRNKAEQNDRIDEIMDKKKLHLFIPETSILLTGKYQFTVLIISYFGKLFRERGYKWS